jgi:nicotinamidase/pyrazinamidase
MDPKVFFDVDTQLDFIEPCGALPVPGAEEIRPNLALLTKAARACGIRIVGDVDSHFGTEEYRKLEARELKKWGGPFELHCERGTRGWEKIPETAPLDPLFVGTKKLSVSELARARMHKGELYFEKQFVDVSENPNFCALMEGVGEATVYGVATDYCVKCVALALLGLGAKVTVVTDAVKPVFPQAEGAALEEMRLAGAEFATTREVVSKLAKKRALNKT